MDCPDGAADTLITANHGHALLIAPGTLLPSTPLTLIGIQGDSVHNHTIDLSADDVDTLLGGGSVTVTSSFFGHDHDVTVECV